MKDQIPVYIGYDERESVAWHVCVKSILEHTKSPERFRFHAVSGEQRDGSNSFIYQRFLIPWLNSWQGHAIFLDGDMLVRTDLADLYAARDHGVGVQVVQHDYKTKHPTKYLGAKNEDYPRKNWSSVILWNCAFYPNRVLTPEFVAKADGGFLHRFQWLDQTKIGALPKKWNRLVMEEPIEKDDAIRHFTIGTPCFDDYMYVDGSDEWWDTYLRMIAPVKP